MEGEGGSRGSSFWLTPLTYLTYLSDGETWVTWVRILVDPLPDMTFPLSYGIELGVGMASAHG